MKQEYKVGDRVLVKKFGGSMFHAFIMSIVPGFWGDKYYIKWTINDRDYNYTYETGGKISRRNIICKN